MSHWSNTSSPTLCRVLRYSGSGLPIAVITNMRSTLCVTRFNSTSSFLERTKGLEEHSIKNIAKVRQDFATRWKIRYWLPSVQWWKNTGTEPWQNRLLLRKSDATKIPSLKLNSLNKPLQLGDLVLLRNSNELSMCISLPQSSSDPRYAFQRADGTIIFAQRNSILIRFPLGTPSRMSRKYSILQKESKHDFTPIGIVKNNIDETFIVPVVARLQVTSPMVTEISKKARRLIPKAIGYLGTLYRTVQNHNGSFQVPFSKLIEKNLDPSWIMAIYWAIQHQQSYNMWGHIHLNRATLFPSSVTIIPFKDHARYMDTLENLIDNHGDLALFTKCVNNRNYEMIERKLSHIKQLVHDYASGNLARDDVITTLIAKIFRKVEKYKSQDLTKDMCAEVLNDLSGKSNNYLLNNKDLGLPETSRLLQNYNKIYQLAIPNTEEIYEADISRTDFKDLKVYCIDSADAHEIDDGVSILRLAKNRYKLFVHIADPGSLFKECRDSSTVMNDEILRIASHHGFTVYLPELASPMLPASYTKLCDLGHQGKETNTLTFSIEVEIVNSTITLLYSTFKVHLGKVSNFQKITYIDTDAELAKKTDYPSDIQKLYEVSKLLRKNRIENNGAIIFGEGMNRGIPTVENVNGNNIITFKDNVETPSTILVSELMIMANTLTAKFFRENKIPGIYRAYDRLPLGLVAEREFNELCTKTATGCYPTLPEIVKLAPFLNTSFYTAIPKSHNMIGADSYLTVTSPLRRFPDMVNHLQLHRFLRKLPYLFEGQKLEDLVGHLQSRADLIKKYSNQICTYWTLKSLMDRLKASPEQNNFSVIISSLPTDGYVKGVISGFTYAKVQLRLHPQLRKYPEIGEVVRNCRITKIDCLDGTLELDLPTKMYIR